MPEAQVPSPLKPSLVLAKTFIPGLPRPQGSMKAFKHKTTDKVIMTHSKGKELMQWRKLIALEVKSGADPSLLLLSSGGYVVAMTFLFPRPQYHLASDGSVKERFTFALHRTKPDIDKLQRAVFDALTGIVWTDDSNVIGCTELMKSYGASPGLIITIGHITEPQNATEAGLFV